MYFCINNLFRKFKTKLFSFSQLRLPSLSKDIHMTW